MPQLALFYSNTCPYCMKVERYMRANGVDIPMLSTADADNRRELIEKGGMYQVPCLRIDDTYLYESDDIIEYLRKNVVEKQ
jgi:glutaredoxin 3